MRAKFGIKDREYAGDIGNAWCKAGAASARYRKFSDNAGMKCSKSVELPKGNPWDRNKTYCESYS